jgi:hypothetical protein
LIALLAGIYFVAYDKDIQGFSLILGDVLLFGGAFVYDRLKKRSERIAPAPDAEETKPTPNADMPNQLTSSPNSIAK